MISNSKSMIPICNDLTKEFGEECNGGVRIRTEGSYFCLLNASFIVMGLLPSKATTNAPLKPAFIRKS